MKLPGKVGESTKNTSRKGFVTLAGAYLSATQGIVCIACGKMFDTGQNIIELDAETTVHAGACYAETVGD